MLRRPRVGVTNTRVETSETPEEAMERKARQLIKEFSVEEIALVQRRKDTTLYTGDRHKAPKRHGGSPPVDYEAVEAYTDLAMELERANPDQQVITRNFFYLKALLR